MDIQKLVHHVKLCRKNLKSQRVNCCSQCPFEEEIIAEYPDLKKLFIAKRKSISQRAHEK